MTRLAHVRLATAVLVLASCGGGGEAATGGPDAADQPADGSSGACRTKGDCPAIPCMAAFCPAEGRCAYNPLPQGSACSSADACLVAESCDGAGKCAGRPRDCDDQDPCTDDRCEGGVCLHPAAAYGTPCEDGSPCTIQDHCSQGKCFPGLPACNCTSDFECVDDGDKCNGIIDGCDLTTHVCVESVPQVVCSPPDRPCRSVACVPATGECVELLAPPGHGCQSSDPCRSGACDSAGACVLTPKCAGDQCNDPTCDEATGLCGLAPRPDTTLCDDGIACTGDDHCASGACGGAPIDCDDVDACTGDSCDPATGCSNEDDTATCSDGDPCTTQDACPGGA